MTIRISRRMEYADRFGIQQADQAIKRDVVRALVELITNSDDSYRRLERRGRPADGRIILELRRRRLESIIRVIDFAEGMNSQNLDKALGVYAEDTSGFTKGEPVRGYFGRGVKDAILGLGSGRVSGIVQGRQHQAWLGIRNSQAFYEAQDAVRAPGDLLNNLGGRVGSNATVVEITISRQGVRIPHFDNLKRQLSLFFSLRDILTNPNRSLLLREVDPNGRVRREFNIAYEFPVCREVRREVLTVADSDVRCQAVLYRADVPLDTPREAGYYAQAGLLIKGENAIFDNTLLGFDGDIHAQRFFGSVFCAHLDELLRRNELILLATRDGLDRSHPFVRELFRACEDFLKPFIQEEARRARSEEHRVQNERLQQKLSNALSHLNRIAQDELAQLDPDGDGEPESPFVPESGFGFVPEYTNIQLARRKTVLIRTLVPRIVPEGASVTVTSDNPHIIVLSPQVPIESKEEFPWVGEARVVLEGRQVGAEAVLTAECEGLTAEGLARVIARPEPPNGGGGRRRSGLFHEIKFSDVLEVRRRVRYDRETHDIIIAIKHPSVSPYIADSGGKGTDTAQGQVMLAELVVEAICGAIAGRGIETGRFAAPVGGEVEANQAQQLRLQNRYAGLVHQMIVDSDYRQG